MRRDPENLKRFSKRPSFAGVLQPGDHTRYEMIVVDDWDTIDVVVLNDEFFDKITFLKRDKSFYHSFREQKTNPWTLKAAEEMMNLSISRNIRKTVDDIMSGKG